MPVGYPGDPPLLTEQLGPPVVQNEGHRKEMEGGGNCFYIFVSETVLVPLLTS